MSTTFWPVLCWQLGPEVVVGRAIGAELELVRSDVRKVLADLSLALREQDSPTLEDAQHKRIVLQHRPVWRGDRGQFPARHTVPVPVDAVFGVNTMGSRSCFLPRLNVEFHYSERDRLDDLIVWFAAAQLREREVEEIYRLQLGPTPTLERVNAPTRTRGSAGPERSTTPRLDAVAERLPAPQGRYNPAWQRDALVQQVVELLGPEGGSVALVGEPGVGRSTILHEAVRRSRRGAVPVYRSSAHRLVAGAKYLGEWQEAIDTLVGELSAVSGVLWIEDLIELGRVGGKSPSASVAAYLAPALLRRRARVVGELTPSELDALRGILPDFAALLRIVPVPELGRAEVDGVLDDLAASLARDRKLTLEPRALSLARRLAERHLHEEAWPGRVVRLLGDCVRQAQDAGRTEVTEADVQRRFTERTGMPARLVDDAVVLTTGQIRDALHQKIQGQMIAVSALAEIVGTLKAGLNDPDRPIATLLFAGPTGVGKTALARALARFLYGGEAGDAPEDRLIRVDMSELQHLGQVERLLGGPDGEVGTLVRGVRQRPFSVVLFDEIEKANPVFFDLLLGVLDEGRLTDALGRTTSFRSCVIVMTTNLGSGQGRSLGFGGDGGGTGKAIRDFFRPEFLNRIDRVLHFDPISPAVARQIVRIELAELSRREGLVDRGLRLHFTDALVEWVVGRGFDAAYGARALQRTLEAEVVAALARHLIAGPGIREQDLYVDVEDGAVVVA